MSTPFKECPSCGAHLDAGERCDCKETAAADRAQANTARITPPARAALAESTERDRASRTESPESKHTPGVKK